jgi:hypothetical protein
LYLANPIDDQVPFYGNTGASPEAPILSGPAAFLF